MRNGRGTVPFGDVDPILGRNASFFAFALPLLQSVHVFAQALILVAGLGSAALYFVSGALIFDTSTRLAATPAARRHLALLAAVFFVTLAFGAWLGRIEHLTSRSAFMYGATYADVHGRMPAAFLLVIVGMTGAVLSVVQPTSRQNGPVLATIGPYVVVWFGGDLYSSGLQRFVVSPNEQALETLYIQHNIDATRRAFALDAVDEQELSGNAPLTRDDITRNSATLENVRLWDHQPLLDTFGPLQEIRTYYDFVSVDNDRYWVNGAYRQVTLSARELTSGSLQSRTWVNERLTFTHGYGITLGPVNEVTPEGLPLLFVQNLPPETRADLPLLRGWPTTGVARSRSAIP